MRRRTKLVIISGAIFSSTSLLIFTQLLDLNRRGELQPLSDPVAVRLCQGLQQMDRLAAAASPSAQAPPALGGAASEPCLPQRAGRAVRRAAGWIGLQDRAVSGGAPALLASVRLSRWSDASAPWSDATVRQAGPGTLDRVGFGDLAAGLPLRPGARAEESKTRSLAMAAGALGVLLSGVAALRFGRAEPRERHGRRVYRLDESTSFLTHYALVKDLEIPHQTRSPGGKKAGILVTIDFRYLERNSGFLCEEDAIRILTKACQAINKGWPEEPGLDFYHVSKFKVALIIRGSAAIPLDDSHACEALLARLLGIISGSIQISSDSVLSWDDVIVTGQRFRLDAPPPSLLTMQTFGELLAAEDRRSFRLMKSGDDLLVKDKNEIRNQLSGLQASDLELHFQPILQLSNPGHFGLELLIRFYPAALRKLGTGKVIQLAHDLGVAHRIDALVVSRLTEVQEAIKASATLSDCIEYVSVNISPDSVCTEQRLNQLISLWKRFAVDSSIFSIEITEMAATDLLEGSDDVTTASERLIKDLNFRIFIDDFGSGLSNYKRISEAWYDAIKLDTDLIKGIDRSFRLQRYVGSFIDTVHALGKTVVCEGIETHNELNAVVRLGADALQGYLISRPIPLAEVEAFLGTSEWAKPDILLQTLRKIRESSHLLDSDNPEKPQRSKSKISLERYIFDNWSRLRSFEEFVLLFVNELKSWGLSIHRFSLAFLPDQDDIDCSQYVWVSSRPGRVATLLMDREFLEGEEHLHSPLHFIASSSTMFRQKLTCGQEYGFPFLDTLSQSGCSDYLGIRLDSRGISIPVLTIALHEESTFNDKEMQRIEAMSSLLSLLFYAFESERSKRLAMLDPLTNLANRRSFDSFLKGNITASRLAQVNLALALIDIDRFKAVNDLMGHAYGDRCLKEIAETLSACLRCKNDFVARLGGEEFALILPHSDATVAQALCEELRQSILRKDIFHPGHGNANPLTVSIGIAVWDPLSDAVCDADRLLQLADDCLYEAKRAGRNRVVCRPLEAP